MKLFLKFRYFLKNCFPNQPSPLSIKPILPESILGTELRELENMSQELTRLTLESLTSIEGATNSVEPLNVEATQQRSAGKRSAKGAELESGSIVVPR